MNKILFLSGSEPEIIEKLYKLGYNTFTCVNNPALENSISSHADCALFTPDGSTYFIEENNFFNLVNYLTKGEGQERAEDKKIIRIEGIKSPYPDDVKLNAKAFGKKILCNKDCIASEIKLFASENCYELIHCNQGYSACSTVKLSDYAAITDDVTVYNTLASNGIDCLMVSKGSVKLKGFSYGFIGGCCGMIEDNLIAFAGNIDTHSDSDIIKSFLKKHSVDYINLTDGELTDIGGIILL